MVLPIIQYGSIAYDVSNNHVLNSLDPVNHQGVRLALGAFKTSPTISLLAEANIKTLEQLRMESHIRYMLKTLSIPENPVSHCVTYTEYGPGPQNQTSLFRAVHAALELGIPVLDTVDCYSRKFPSWKRKKYRIDLTLTKYDKDKLPHKTIQRHFTEHTSKFPNFFPIYTDGSKTIDHVGAAYFSPEGSNSFSLSKCCSVFTAEAYALWRAVLFASDTHHPYFLICSDSLSCLTALKSDEHPHPLLTRIQDHIFKSRKTFRFLWIPSHCGILGNERADQLAGNPSNATCVTYQCSKDLSNLAKNAIQDLRNKLWDRVPLTNKLRQVKHDLSPIVFPDNFSRKEKTVITRLRIGHTNLTHIHLIERTPPPLCRCGDTVTVNHLFTCHGFAANRINNNIDGIEDLSNTQKLKNIINFLKEINLYWAISFLNTLFLFYFSLIQHQLCITILSLP